ncbi:uncharacterized protein LOC123306191 isoform X2 [Chrysoperla carnea]|nr:uncharacterized protein LOC123306191 isoform X2 [Chrysoperla carnea]
MHGARRVIAFCCLTAVLPTILIILPLYLRHSIYIDVAYPVAESDVIEVKDGISSIFCQKHIVRMNTTFNAYQLHEEPEISSKRKHIRLKKSIMLPDDTLEYWGFYLLNQSTVALKVCSRYEGSRILVVEGDRNLRTCGLLEHNKDKFGGHFAKGAARAVKFFESNAQEIHDATNITKNILNEKIDDEKLEKITETMLENRLKPKRHKRRHAKHRNLTHEEKRNRLKRDLESAIILDGGVEHGGNAANHTGHGDQESSVSSFENDLLKCYDGQILLSKEFSPNRECTDIHFLDSSGAHMETIHEVQANGYYYYIFYSDNDLVSNDIHAVFDIYKPTYQYANIPQSKECKNKTECTFNIPFMSSERVIVEVPTRDGIEHEEDDISMLISTCEPRMAIYMIFPIAVLFLILLCAFL